VEGRCDEAHDATHAVALGAGLFVAAQEDQRADHAQDGAEAAAEPVRRHQEAGAREGSEYKRHSGEVARAPHL
jgi:hypothetical protein